jgi:hypothetical protein
MVVLKRNYSRTKRVRIARAVSERPAVREHRKPMKAGRCWRSGGQAAAASMSAGVRAREMIIVNGDREFSARLVIVEQRELICL